MAKLRAATELYIREGAEVYQGESIHDIERKALHTELNPAGGYLLVPERDNSPLATFLREVSPMRQRAQVRQIMTELWAQAVTSQKLLDDATLTWLTDEIVETFSVQESDAWFTGNGVIQPCGLLTYPFVVPTS
jgi:predicted phage gp36 major capsid-like protein